MSPKDIAKLFKKGSVGVLLTDTIYGICARVEDLEAVQKLYTLKNRHNKPGTVIAYSIEQLVELGIKYRYLSVFKEYWPNPLSVVVPVSSKLDYLDQKKGSLAVRLPKDNRIQKILKLTGPLITSSANLPQEPFAKNVEEARSYFGDKVDFYVDSGDSKNHQPSTIVRMIDDEIEILRDGEFKFNS